MDRPARPVLVFQRFRREHAAAVVRWLSQAPVPGMEPPPGEAWADRMEQAEGLEAFVAVDPGRDPVAMGRLDLLPGGEAELTLVVDPAWRRRGVGAALVEEAVRRCRVLGRSRLTALASARNVAAGRFFRSVAFAASEPPAPEWERYERWIHGGGSPKGPLVVEDGP